ncbi:DUF4260 family protein [Virgibacillus flavescens]|uniref:DUF4260 family protein n=1 Tax=Virgibacillus flavescens TaxID=1611422 RepID=UPI003D33147A
MNKLILHMEGLGVLVTALYFYSQAGVSWWMFFILLLALGLIWLALVGMDRTVGYGLKEPSDFKVTLLQKI